MPSHGFDHRREMIPEGVRQGPSSMDQGRRAIQAIQEAKTQQIANEYLDSARQVSPDSRSGWPSYEMNTEAYGLIISNIEYLRNNGLFDKSIADKALKRLYSEFRAAEFEESVLEPPQQTSDTGQEAKTQQIANEYLDSARQVSPDSRSGWPSHKMNTEAYGLIISNIEYLRNNSLFDKSIADKALKRLYSEFRAAEFEESVLGPHQQTSGRHDELHGPHHRTEAFPSDRTHEPSYQTIPISDAEGNLDRFSLRVATDSRQLVPEERNAAGIHLTVENQHFEVHIPEALIEYVNSLPHLNRQLLVTQSIGVRLNTYASGSISDPYQIPRLFRAVGRGGSRVTIGYWHVRIAP